MAEKIKFKCPIEAPEVRAPRVTNGIKIVSYSIPVGRAKGDINGDGVVDNKDESTLIAFIHGGAQLDDEQKDCANINNDENVDGTDLEILESLLSHTSSYSGYATLPDTKNNWVYAQSLWDKGQGFWWYYDLELPEDLSSAAYSITVNTSIDNLKGCYATRATSKNNKSAVRIYTQKLPKEEIPCTIIGTLSQADDVTDTVSLVQQGSSVRDTINMMCGYKNHSNSGFNSLRIESTNPCILYNLLYCKRTVIQVDSTTSAYKYSEYNTLTIDRNVIAQLDSNPKTIEVGPITASIKADGSFLIQGESNITQNIEYVIISAVGYY